MFLFWHEIKFPNSVLFSYFLSISRSIAFPWTRRSIIIPWSIALACILMYIMFSIDVRCNSFTQFYSLISFQFLVVMHSLVNIGASEYLEIYNPGLHSYVFYVFYKYEIQFPYFVLFSHFLRISRTVNICIAGIVYFESPLDMRSSFFPQWYSLLLF